MVNYEILHGNYEDMFHIDEQSGKIVVKSVAGQKKSPPNEEHITLTVRAYDLGIPQMSSSTKVFIYEMVCSLTLLNHINRLAY